jgi:hypothetical protein
MLLTLTGCLLGMLLGMRHALEPDHLAAIATLVTEDRSARQGLLLGALWGIGHSLALLVVGMVLGILHAEMPPWLSRGLEWCVALMLVSLGIRALRRTLTRAEDAHACPVAVLGNGRKSFTARSLTLGIVHGLAGSGALTAFVVANLPTMPIRVAYVALFGIGSMVGMALLSGLASWPLECIGRSQRGARTLGLASGCVSIAFGLLWSWTLALAG